MSVQGCDCVRLAEQYGTPLHVVDKNRLKKNYFSFYNSFRECYSHIEIGYSYKTNPIPGVLKLLHDFGASAEVVSPNELHLALKLGVHPENIIYNGPGKTEEGLMMAISNKVKLINIDSHEEINLINRLAKQHNHKQQVGIRVVTSVGWKTKFGFNIESGDAFKAFKSLSDLENVVPCGLHLHLSTGIGNPNTYLKAIKEALDLSILIRKELDIHLKYFDFGGGFDNITTVRSYSNSERKLFENYFPVQEPRVRPVPSLDEYSKPITELFTEYYGPELDSSPTIIFEPGRAITSSAQFLLLKVLAIKPARNGIKDVILDGGKNVAPPLDWECHTVFNASRIQTPPDAYYSLFGPLCTPYDVIYHIKKLPSLGLGDILAIMDTGAYFTSMQSNFCSFPKSAAVLIQDGHHQLIRRKESFEDLMAKDLDFI